MAEYFVVAMPEISSRALQWIQTIREAHDPNARIIAPHFTLAFSLQDLSQEALCSHVDTVRLHASAIRFHCQSVTLGQDHASPVTYVFLVPNVGGSDILKLRNLLHTGVLKRHLRPEIPFTPHLTLAASESAEEMQHLCERLNEAPPSISGTISSLSLVCRCSGAVREVYSVSLPER